MIGKSISTWNKVGRVFGVRGDESKRKFAIALENSGELALSNRSFRKNSESETSVVASNQKTTSEVENTIAAVGVGTIDDIDLSEGFEDASLSSENESNLE